MRTLFADVRHSVRVLLKSPGFTAVAVAALALGIGANTAIFSVVNAVLLKPLPYPQPDRIMSLMRKFPNGYGGSISIPKFVVWRQNNVFDSMAAYNSTGPGMNLVVSDRPEPVRAIHASVDYFRVFGAQMTLGRSFLPEEDRPGGARVAVLAENLWDHRFGRDNGIAGRTINLNNDLYTVIGVVSKNFQPDPPVDVFIPLQADPNSTNQGHYLAVAGRLKPGVPVTAANAEMKIVGERFRRAYPKFMDEHESVGVRPMQEVVGGDVRLPLLILTAAVGFVLLIACANVANLLLARAAGRQREVAIRAAIGANRFRLIRQLLTESIVLALMGGIAGLAIGAWGVRVLLAYTPGDIPRVTANATSGNSVLLTLDWSVVAFTFGIAVLTGIVFGLFPALQISRTDLASTLKENSSRGGTGLRQNKTRGVLIVAEIALALVLLAGAALMIRTFSALRGVDPGFDMHHVLTMQTSLGGTRYAKTAQVETLTREVLQRIEALPGVEAAASTIVLPLEGGVDLPLIIEGRPLQGKNQAHGDEQWRCIAPHYFKALKVPLLRGRFFDDHDDSKSAKVVIINEEFAHKYWPKGDPLGQQITIGKGLGPEFEEPSRIIVGVVGNVLETGLGDGKQPAMYVPVVQVTDGLTKLAGEVLPTNWLIRTPGDPLKLSNAIQQQFLAVDNQLPVAQIRTMEQVLTHSVARQNFNMLLLTIFAGIALLLASIGIYGLMSYSVEQRSHEIGIRMALGAEESAMVRLVVRDGMKLAIIGLAVGLAAAYGLTRFLGTLLFGVRATDPATYIFVAALLGAVAFLASYIPAKRAAKVDPIIALRYE
ncbi:MAG: ABC transporter permease [Bryobacteraceae bacterium]|jgi:predicted permease